MERYNSLPTPRLLDILRHLSAWWITERTPQTLTDARVVLLFVRVIPISLQTTTASTRHMEPYYI
eukprot:9776479-Prorocentrum_lima.AAC.1